jgi:hypothetical protein
MLSNAGRLVITQPGDTRGCLDASLGRASPLVWVAARPGEELSGTDARRAPLSLGANELHLTGFSSYETVSGRRANLCEFFTSSGEVWHRSGNSEGKAACYLPTT